MKKQKRIFFSFSAELEEDRQCVSVLLDGEESTLEFIDEDLVSLKKVSNLSR